MYYYDSFIDRWYPKKSDGSYQFGQPEFWYSYLIMPARLLEADRARWYKYPASSNYTTGGMYTGDIPIMPNVMWLSTWGFSTEDGNMSVLEVPTLADFPKRDKDWLKIGSREIDLNNIPDFASMPSNPGFGYAGELVIVDEYGVEYEFECWYESAYTDQELVGDFIVINVGGKRAVCKLYIGDKNKKIYIGESDLHT